MKHIIFLQICLESGCMTRSNMLSAELLLSQRSRLRSCQSSVSGWGTFVLFFCSDLWCLDDPFKFLFLLLLLFCPRLDYVSECIGHVYFTKHICLVNFRFILLLYHFMSCLLWWWSDASLKSWLAVSGSALKISDLHLCSFSICPCWLWRTWRFLFPSLAWCDFSTPVLP